MLSLLVILGEEEDEVEREESSGRMEWMWIGIVAAWTGVVVKGRVSAGGVLVMA